MSAVRSKKNATRSSIVLKKQEKAQVKTKSKCKEPIEVYHDGYWLWVDARDLNDRLVTKTMLVTPEWAAEVLEKRNTSNRKMKNSDKIVRAIQDGTWEDHNPNGISFYADGIISDGQHRLDAVVKADEPVNMRVTFGVPRKAAHALDSGTIRSTNDTAQIMGFESSSKLFSITNYILEMKAYYIGRDDPDYKKHRKPNKLEQIAFYQKHEEAVKFVADSLQRVGIATAPVTSVLTRAYYSVDHTVLARFMYLLESGVGIQEDEIAVAGLRSFLLSNVRLLGGQGRIEKYQKTQFALKKFVNKEPMPRLFASKTENFLLPGETIEGGIL